MTKFALQEVEIPFTRERFFKLMINRKDQLEESWKELEQQGHGKLLDTVQSNVTLKAQGEAVPPKKLTYLGRLNKKDPYQAFEFRTNRIRLYGFLLPGKGHVLVNVHLKDEKTQKKLLADLSETIREYHQEVTGSKK